MAKFNERLNKIVIEALADAKKKSEAPTVDAEGKTIPGRRLSATETMLLSESTMRRIRLREVNTAMITLTRQAGSTEDWMWEAAGEWSLARPEGYDNITRYLSYFGFKAAALDKWSVVPSQAAGAPQLSLKCKEATKQGGKSFYKVDCTFGPLTSAEGGPKPGGRASIRALRNDDQGDGTDSMDNQAFNFATENSNEVWQAPRTCDQVRDGIDAALQKELGASYAGIFGGSPLKKNFMNSFFGNLFNDDVPPATMGTYMNTLADITNKGKLSPDLTARVIMFFRGLQNTDKIF